ncbi:MAG TPA: hypothetical protein VFX92_02200 [Candidatus Krumholzibacteria bacterium]|nr:hypothetical protein [Candidatus Krumholzibacteria bacterium]
MRNKTSFLFVIALLAAVMSSCIFDPAEKKNEGGGPVESFLPLNEKVNVLSNLQLAYNRRIITEYDKLLDLEFVFFLADGDVGGGLPVSWDRTTEIGTNKCLFDRVGCPGKPVASSVTMELMNLNQIQWTKLIPASAPDEEWQTTTVFYNFQIEIGDTKYVPYAGAKAQFTVRNVGTDSQPKWQLVEWRDLGASN